MFSTFVQHSSEHLLQFLVCYLRVVLLKQCLLLRVVVEGAIMGFEVSMLWAVYVSAFAFSLYESDFTTAFPALAFVFLITNKS